MTDYKIIDNALPEDYFNKLQSIIMGDSFPWFYANAVALKDQPDPNFYFTHAFYKHQKPWSEHFDLLVPLLDSKSLGVKSMMRIKANLYPRTHKLEHHGKHIDMKFKHKGAILYINENNGLTVLQDGTTVESIPNRLLLFDPSIPHNSTTCTDAKCRININMNYF